MSGRAERPLLLVVDDEPRILSALQRCLRREPYEIATAEGAQAALRTLRSRRVDALLTDHKMPGVSGLDLIREVATQWPGIPRVLLTGWAAEIAPEQLSRLGIRALVPKPWNDAELKAVLREALGLREPAGRGAGS